MRSSRRVYHSSAPDIGGGLLSGISSLCLRDVFWVVQELAAHPTLSQPSALCDSAVQLLDEVREVTKVSSPYEKSLVEVERNSSPKLSNKKIINIFVWRWCWCGV